MQNRTTCGVDCVYNVFSGQRKSVSARLPWLPALVSGAIGLGMLVVAASAGPGSSPSSRGAVTVPNCRVLFTERRTLSSERAGILQVVANEGWTLEAGEVAFRLDDRVPRAALSVAEARAASDVSVRTAEKAAESARAEFEIRQRANESSQSGSPIFPASEILRRRLAAEAALLEVESALQALIVLERERDRAKADVAAFSRTSPINGTVTRVFRRDGETVRQSEPVLEIVDTQKVRIEGFVPVETVFDVRAGQQVTVRLDVPDDEFPIERITFQGRLGFVDSSVQPISRSVRVWAEIENRDGILRDGLTATMIIDTVTPSVDRRARSDGSAGDQ